MPQALSLAPVPKRSAESSPSTPDGRIFGFTTPKRRKAVSGEASHRSKGDAMLLATSRADAIAFPSPAPARELLSGLVKVSYLAVHSDGRSIQLVLPGLPQQPVKRGKCDGMSEDAGRRLEAFLQTLRRDAPLPTMQSLTFPEEVIVTPDEAKQCRKAFEKKIIRRHPEYASIWRLEAHPEMSTRLGRVCPHFHCLVWGAWFDLQWCSDEWTSTVWEVLRIDDCLMDKDGRSVKEKHRLAGVNTEKVKRWAGVIYCAKKYIAKDEEYPLGEAGRVWGYCQRRKLPISSVRRIVLTNEQTIRAVQFVWRWMKSKNIKSEYLLRRIFVDDPDFFATKILSEGTFG